MPALSYWLNVHNTALVVLKRKGFRVWRERESDLICAEKNGWDFFAHDSVQLLGIVAIFEFQQPKEFREYWWKIDEPYLADRVPVRPPRYTPIWKRKAASIVSAKKSASKKMKKRGSSKNKKA